MSVTVLTNTSNVILYRFIIKDDHSVNKTATSVGVGASTKVLKSH